MTSVKEGLTGREFLDRVYSRLFLDWETENVEFENPLHILVAQDADLGRIDRGTMRYDEGRIVTLKPGRTYLFSKGSPDKSHVSMDRYIGDIRVGEGRDRESLKTIMSNAFPFHNSALLVSTRGDVGVSKLGIFKELRKYVVDAETFDMNPGGEPVYSMEFAEMWTKGIEEVLKNRPIFS